MKSVIEIENNLTIKEEIQQNLECSKNAGILKEYKSTYHTVCITYFEYC